MKTNRIQLRDIGAAACAREECVAGVGGDGTVYLTHIAFEVEDERGLVLGVLQSSNLSIPLSRMEWTPNKTRGGTPNVRPEEQ